MKTVSTMVFRAAALIAIAMARQASLGASSEVAQTVPIKNPPVYEALKRVPQRARGKRNPLTDSPNAIAAGRKLFEEHCVECHGMTAEGTRRGPSLRDESVHRATPGAIFWIVTNGVVRRGMPSWSKLPEVQRWQIVTFLSESR
jgi:mono/diheme cytochrome c family protein